MPFIAIEKDTKKRIDVTSFDNPKEALAGKDLMCQDEDCQAPLFIRSGDFYEPHFVHYSGYEDRNCVYRESGGESELHREAKEKIILSLQRSVHFKDAKIVKELIVKQNDIKRKIDIYTELGEWRMAHEAQLSNQSIEKFKERTEDYYRFGIVPVWWLGDAALTRENRNWCERNCDFVGYVTVVRRRDVIVKETF